MGPTIEKLSMPPLKVAEGPHWDTASHSLYLVGNADSLLIRYDPKTDKSYQTNPGLSNPSFIIPVAGSKGKFVVGSECNIYIIEWDGISEKVDSVELLFELTNYHEDTRINDAKCDATGRLWFGSMSSDFFNVQNGKLYSYSKADGCREYASGIGISNGIVCDGDFMYYIDTIPKTVDCFDHNCNGNIGNRRVLFDFTKNGVNGYPDGMTIDKEGNLWVACFDGSQVINIDPKSGALTKKVSIPTPQVTSVAWGGPNLEDLYVTTAGLGPNENQPGAGCVYRVTGLSTSGLPMHNFKL